jgi:hypothetical protein
VAAAVAAVPAVPARAVAAAVRVGEVASRCSPRSA